MIVVKLMGGLGNQMFQYAFGSAQADKIKTSAYYDLSFYDDQVERPDYTPRKLALSVFGLEIPKISNSELANFKRTENPITAYDRLYKYLSGKKYYLQEGLHYDSNADQITNNTYCEGYFQDERYFKNISDKIRSIFAITPENIDMTDDLLQLEKEISQSESICIHIRRGDYISNPNNTKIFGILNKKYYIDAMGKIESKRGTTTHKYLFSNDLKWCRETFKDRDDITFVDDRFSGPNGTTHFWLMSKCKYFVIPNSSFSWWAAWLSNYEEKVICRPDPWFINQEFINVDMCPQSWEKIARG